MNFFEIVKMSYEAKGEYLFIWKIENYSFCPPKNKKLVISSLFSTENIGDSLWYMYLYPKGADEKSQDYASVYIARWKNDIRTDVNNIDIKFEIVAPDGSILISKKSENASIKRGGFVGWRKFFDIKEMTLAMEKWKEDTLVIHCTLINRKPLICEARTKVVVDHCIFKWNVKFQSNSNPILPMEREREFCLCDTLDFDINLIAPNDDIKLSVSKRDNDIFVPKLSCRVSLLDADGSEVVSKRATHMFDQENNSVWEFPTFISVKYLEDNKDSLLRNGVFTLLFEFYLAKEKDPVVVTNPIFNSLTEKCDIITLRENLQQMYCSNLHTDIQLQIDGKLFQAHKSVLAARSPVFKAMFEQDMIESQTGVVNIPDVDADDFGMFLEFLYTARVENIDYETASKLIILADKYQIPTLKVNCGQVLRSHLSVENACEVINLADMINHEGLKAFVVDFIAAHAKEILTSSEWMKWSEKNSKLASEVVSNIVINFEVVPKKSHK